MCGDKSSDLSSSARRVQSALESLGYSFEIMELAQTTRTAAEAAAAIGCQVEQIAKSLVFRSKLTGAPVLIIASGTNRVGEKAVGALRAEPIEKADAAFVRQHTGFAIGGVPPVGHAQAIETYIDEDLMQHDVIWAAAGTPNAVFPLDPTALPRMTGGRVIPIT